MYALRPRARWTRSLILALLALGLAGWTVRGPDGAPTDRSVDAARLFAPAAWPGGSVSTDPAALGQAAASALAWLREEAGRDPAAAHAGLLGEHGVTLERVEATLAFVARVAAEDARLPAQRLQDPAFWAEHFELYAWRASAWGNPDDRVRLTKYLVWQVEGSLDRTERYNTALYAVPEDEAGLSLAEADARKAGLLRYRYDRPAVLSGVYEAGGEAEGRAFPLVYLSREDALQAQLQGTIEARLEDGRARLFNVDRPNGFAYVKGASLESQPRYWYFRPVDGLYGYGPSAERRVRLVEGVSVAGDVYNLGVGKLVALSWSTPAGRQVRLAVLGDTGGAFQPNLGQLDLLAGTFPSRAAFQDATAGIPDRVEAGVVVLKQQEPPR